MKYITKGFLLIMIVAVLSACGDKKELENEDELLAIEDIYTHLEETVTIEQDLEDVQTEINTLEKADDDLYNKIIKLGKEDYEQVVELAEEATTLLDERMEILKKEKAIFESSKVEFEKVEKLMEDLVDVEKITRMNKLFNTMTDRYEAYDTMHDSYAESLELTRALYVLVQEEVYNEGEMFSLVNDINESYDAILIAKEDFNENVKLYNEYKKEFYDFLNQENEIK